MKRKLTAGVFAVIMAASLMMGGVQVKAAGGYTTITGSKTTTFDKYLVMDKEANVPNVSFTYAITAGDAKTYTKEGETYQILAGVDADQVTMAGVGSADANTIAYKQGDSIKTGDNAAIKNYNPQTKKYAAKEATLDFSKCKFSEPGIYRYILTESGTNQAVTNDDELSRVLDVYVINDDTDTTGKTLKIESYALHSSADVDSDNVTKSEGFTNDYDTSNLTFRKEVTGNQASHSKYFKFTVAIEGAVAGTVYDVDLTNADMNIATDKTNAAKLTVGADGTVTQEFYLQHGQEITIKGIARDTRYSVTEDKEDYESTPKAVKDYTDDTNGTIVSTDLKTSYLNTRNGQIPTGVVMTVAPFAAAVVLGGAGVVTFAGRKKREDEE